MKAILQFFLCDMALNDGLEVQDLEKQYLANNNGSPYLQRVHQVQTNRDWFGLKLQSTADRLSKLRHDEGISFTWLIIFFLRLALVPFCSKITTRKRSRFDCLIMRISIFLYFSQLALHISSSDILYPHTHKNSNFEMHFCSLGTR